ncbi:MAG: hypothetical protein JSS12_05380 [Verrucomicrobia bacterium]|nr:hypothetical protein [Verrucomicrobiota bacterium]
MFALSTVSRLFWGSPKNDDTDHDIYLGGFDFYIKYILQKMSSSLYSVDDRENCADWLRKYYRTKLQNVRVIKVDAFRDLVDVVRGKEKQKRLRELLPRSDVIGWNENALAMERQALETVIFTDFSLHSQFGHFTYSPQDRSTCEITPFDYPPKEPIRSEHATRLMRMNDVERFTILLYAHNSSTLTEIERICKTRPDLYQWFCKSNFAERRASFRKKLGEGILNAAAYLEGLVHVDPYTYLRLEERAQLNEILINFLQAREPLYMEELTPKIQQLIRFFNEQPSRASNPITVFGFEPKANLSWDFDNAYIDKELITSV